MTIPEDKNSPPKKTELFSRGMGWLILIGAGLIMVWGIQTMPLGGVNEGRRALTVVEMLRGHNWLIPTMNGHIYIDKPPLVYWLMVISAKLFGSSAEWVLRLPAALAALGICGLLFASLRRYLGRDVGLAAILILATSLTFTQRAHLAEIEMVQSFFCVAASLFFLDFIRNRGQRGPWFLGLSYLCLGLAMLAKGPVALVFFLPPLLLYLPFDRSRRGLLGLRFGRGWLTVLLLGGGWYVAIWFSPAGPLLRQVIDIDILGKAAGGLPDSKPFYNYVINLFGILAPWTLLPLLRLRHAPRLFAHPVARYFALQGLVPLAIMSFFASKHNKYILPLLPALASCLAIFLVDFSGWLNQRYPVRGRKYFFGFAGALLCAYLLFFALVEPRIYVYRNSAFAPLLRELRLHQGQAPLYCAGELKFLQLAYYYGQPIPELNHEEIAGMVAEKRPLLLLAESKSWPLLPEKGLETIVELSPFRSKNRAVRLLTNLRPDQLKAPCRTNQAASTRICELSDELRENSGLLNWAGNLWTFNDSGGKPEIYRIDPAGGTIRQTIRIENAGNDDWEDIAQDQDYIYIGDIGNNQNNRRQLLVYRVRKADIPDTPRGRVRADRISFHFATPQSDLINRRLGNHNCEALACLGDRLVLLTKNNGLTLIYQIPKLPGDYLAGNPITLRIDGVISGADVSPEDGRLALIGRTSLPFICILPDLAPDTLADLALEKIELAEMAGAQAEGIAWIDQRSLLISTENRYDLPELFRVTLPDEDTRPAVSPR